MNEAKVCQIANFESRIIDAMLEDLEGITPGDINEYYGLANDCQLAEMWRCELELLEGIK